LSSAHQKFSALAATRDVKFSSQIQNLAMTRRSSRSAIFKLARKFSDAGVTKAIAAQA
jgi:hypothetical protein